MKRSLTLKTSLIACAMGTLLLAGCQSNSNTQASSKEDACGANQYKNLIGTNAKNLNLSQFAPGTRLLYPTTPMTRDYRIDRLNIHADKDGKIIRLDCN